MLPPDGWAKLVQRKGCTVGLSCESLVGRCCACFPLGIVGLQGSCFCFSCCTQSCGNGGPECQPAPRQDKQPSKGWSGQNLLEHCCSDLARLWKGRMKGRVYRWLWRLLQWLKGHWTKGRMGRKEDAVDGFYTFLIFLSSLGSCPSCQKSPECRSLAEASGGSWCHSPSLSLAPCEPTYLLSSHNNLFPWVTPFTICCEKCIPPLHLLLDHYSGYLLVLELHKVMTQFVPIYLPTTGGFPNTCYNLPHSSFFQFEA